MVLYTTGVKVVRDTYDKCLRVKKTLQTHMVRYEERDISISRDNHRQLAERLGGSSNVELPQVFADGLHIGVRRSHRRHVPTKCGVPLKSSSFETEQHIGNLKHVTEA